MKKNSGKDLGVNRWVPVVAGVAIQLCLGTVYIWGVFQPAIVELFHLPQSTVALTFSFLLGCFALGSTIGGMIQDRLTPKPVVVGGGIVLGIGIFLASFTTPERPWWLWFTYGVTGGFGMGATYTAIIACCQKWFLDKRGFITGLIVSALGFGGVVFTPLARYLIITRGVLETFRWFAVIFVAVCVVAGQFIKNPEPGYQPKNWTPPIGGKGGIDKSYTTREMIRTPQFYILTATLFLAAFSGLMVIPFAKVLGMQGGLSDAVATSGVMIISLFNSFGRLFWGAVSDKLGRKNTVRVLLVITGICMLFLAQAQMYVVLILIALISFSYGGYLGVFPAITADFWGLRNMGMNYGIVMFGSGTAAVMSPIVAGYIQDLTNSFTISFLVGAIASFLGIALIFFLKSPAVSQKTGADELERKTVT